MLCLRQCHILTKPVMKYTSLCIRAHWTRIIGPIYAHTDHASDSLVKFYRLPAREVAGLVEGALREEIVVPRVVVVVV